MNAFLGDTPDIIRAASGSLLGVLSLLIMVCSALAFTFFKGANERVKFTIFGLFFSGTILFAVAAIMSQNDLLPKENATMTPKPDTPKSEPDEDVRLADADAVPAGKTTLSLEERIGPQQYAAPQSTRTETNCKTYFRIINNPALPLTLEDLNRGCSGEVTVSAVQSGEAVYKDLGLNDSRNAEVFLSIVDRTNGNDHCPNQARSKDKHFNLFSIFCEARINANRGDEASVTLNRLMTNVKEQNLSPLRVQVRFRPDTTL